MADTVLTAARMRALEHAAIASGAVTGLDLMERAGAGAVAAIRARWPEASGPPNSAVVLCGPGNNGGDGFVVARLLAAEGLDVEVLAMPSTARPPDAETNAARWSTLGPLRPYDASGLVAAGRRAKVRGHETLLVIDAVFGIGQRAPLDDVTAPVNALMKPTVRERNLPKSLFVAIDVPTGYDTDSGDILCARPMPADLTIAFHARKPVHGELERQGMAVVVVGIGL